MRDPDSFISFIIVQQVLVIAVLLDLEYYVDVEEGVGVWEWELGVVEIGSRDRS